MNTRARRLLATTLLLVGALAGCAGSGTEPSTPSVTGTWTGRAVVNPEYAPDFTLNLVEADDGSITGRGRLTTADGAVDVDLTIGAGTSNFPSVSFAILNAGRGDIFFAGQMDASGSSIRGSLNGNGLDGLPLGLTRR